MSLNFDLGPSFHFIKCRSLHFKKYQKVTLFLHKIKTEAYMRNLRKASLIQNIRVMHRRFQVNSVYSN